MQPKDDKHEPEPGFPRTANSRALMSKALTVAWRGWTLTVGCLPKAGMRRWSRWTSPRTVWCAVAFSFNRRPLSRGLLD